MVLRLRAALDHREQGISHHRDRDARLVAEPRERWEQHHYAAAERLERLRTIQAHRRLLDRHHVGGQSPWTGDMTARCVSCFQQSPCETVRDLASIYFPESDATDG